MKKTLVLGASTNPSRYSYMAICSLLQHGFEVVALGNKIGSVKGIDIQTKSEFFADIDTVTLYLSPTNQVPYYQYIINLKPSRVVFNPGAENAEFEQMLQLEGIETLQACTLVMLSTHQY